MPARSLLTVRLPRRRRADRDRELVELGLQLGRRRQRAASQTQLAIAAATWPGYPRPYGQNMMTASGCACVNSQM